MRKLWRGIILCMVTTHSGWSQISQGGLPLSFSLPDDAAAVPVLHRYTAPDPENIIAENGTAFSRPYMVASGVKADLSYPGSGTFRYLQDGRKIWTARIQVSGARAIGLYYHTFVLPPGVRYFIFNKNKKQVLGAYTEANNTEGQTFASEALQGEEATLELDIPANTAPDKISLHIDNIAAYFASVEHLSVYADTRDRPTDTDPYGLEGSSSTCEINAICPEGENYPIQRKATLQTLIPLRNSDGVLVGLGACSATMINNTGNTVDNCKQYVLLATHCDGDNSTEDAHFSDWLFRFNFEKNSCTGGPEATVNTLTGASFRARANYVETTTPEINGDFMLLELNNTIPLSWDVYLAGWNRNTSLPLTANPPEKFIGFHHPAGDVKKLLTASAISPFGEAGGSLGPGTHWELAPIDEGGAEQGSSGSGLFDQKGRLIGVASVAGSAVSGCNVAENGAAVNFYRYIAYSKLSLAWEYSMDGTGSNRRLKPWLDPLNTGAMTAGPLRSDCTAGAAGITAGAGNLPDNAVSIYPTPSTDGLFTARMNLKTPADMQVSVYDISGRLIRAYKLYGVADGSYRFDLRSCPNGVYLFRFTAGNAVVSKKVMITK